MSSGQRARSPDQRAKAPGEGAAAPKKTATPAATRSTGSLPKAGKRTESPPRQSRRERERPPTPAEIAAQKEAAKQAYTAQRRVLEGEFATLKREQDELQTEVDRIESKPEGGADAHLEHLQRQCEETRAQVATATQRYDTAERCNRESVARHKQEKARINSEWEALEEELLEVRERCAQHEEQARRLFQSTEDMRELLKRGADEMKQLRSERWERQGEKALLVADQASAARLGAEQRVQAVSAEAQVTQLAQALDCEDSRLQQEQRRLRRAEAAHLERAAGEKRQMALASTAYPEQIQKEREETVQCKRIAEEKHRELQVVQEQLGKVREEQRQFAELVRNKAAEAWKAETARDSARSARERLEAEAAQIASETKQIQANVSRMSEQNRQLMRDQVKARNDCSAIIQQSIRRDVKDFVKANPDVSSPLKVDGELEVRAARLSLAGFVTNMSPAGVVGPQR